MHGNSKLLESQTTIAILIRELPTGSKEERREGERAGGGKEGGREKGRKEEGG